MPRPDPALASCGIDRDRQAAPHGEHWSRCRTPRRTARSTHAVSFSSRSRNVDTCAVAQTVP